MAQISFIEKEKQGVVTKNESLTKELDGISEVINGKQRQISKLNETLGNANKRIQELEDENQVKESIITNFKQQVVSLRTKCNGLQQELSGVTKRLMQSVTDNEFI